MVRKAQRLHSIHKRIQKIDRDAGISLGAICVTVLVVGYLFTPLALRIARNAVEDINFRLHPSGELAYEYGERHFDGQNPRTYDVRRAEWFFREALALDPSLVYVHHELARIAFLRGDFGSAMSQIDTQISLHASSTPNSYYVRGLIEGYMGDYASSAKDYETFLKVDPQNWAAINDYSWVLLKANRFKDAAAATENGLKYFPNNPWLLNSSAIALYETGDLQKARMRAEAAERYVQGVSEAQWLHSYPGNDPGIASEGIATFRTAVAENMHRIDVALASSTVQ